MEIISILLVLIWKVIQFEISKIKINSKFIGLWKFNSFGHSISACSFSNMNQHNSFMLQLANNNISFVWLQFLKCFGLPNQGKLCGELKSSVQYDVCFTWKIVDCYQDWLAKNVNENWTFSPLKPKTNQKNLWKCEISVVPLWYHKENAMNMHCLWQNYTYTFLIKIW